MHWTFTCNSWYASYNLLSVKLAEVNLCSLVILIYSALNWLERLCLSFHWNIIALVYVNCGICCQMCNCWGWQGYSHRQEPNYRDTKCNLINDLFSVFMHIFSILWFLFSCSFNNLFLFITVDYFGMLCFSTENLIN